MWALLSRILPGIRIPVRLSGTQCKLYVRIGEEIGKQIFVAGQYDLPTTSFMLRFLKPGMVFFDVGANIGHFTVLAARRLEDAGMVCSFEPSQREFALLKANISLNSLNNVRLFRAAVSSAASLTILKVFPSGDGAFNTLGHPSHTRSGTRNTSEERVECITLDSVIEESRFDHVELLKIDVEGGEVDVLRGAGNLMKMEKSPVVICEVGDETLAGFGETGNSLRTVFREFEYDLYAFNADGSLTGVAPWLECYGANYVALRNDHFDKYQIPQHCDQR